MCHPQVVQSPIVNYFLKVKVDGHTELQLVPKCLLQVSVRELHSNLVSKIIYRELKGGRVVDISEYLRNTPPPWAAYHDLIEGSIVRLEEKTISTASWSG